MKELEILPLLQDLVHRLGIELRKIDGDFAGGLCSIQGRRILFVNRGLSRESMVEVFCRELAAVDLSGIFVVPILRERIEAHRQPSHRWDNRLRPRPAVHR